MSPGQGKSESEPAPLSAYAGILLCSAAVLMLEIVLTRIFSFTIWYHLAYLTISTALLGFGAAGSLLAAFPRLLRQAPRLAATCAAGAGLALLAALLVLAPHPLSPDRLLSEPLPFLVELLVYYAAVTLPFLLAGIAIAAPLSRHPAQAGLLYAADLVGAGLGCLAAVAALSWISGPAALAVCAALFAAAGAAYAPRGSLERGCAALALLLAVGSPYADRLLELRPADTKQLGQALREPGTRLLFTRWSPINRVDLYLGANPIDSFWSFFGMSPHYRGPIPRNLSIQYDGHNGSNVYEVIDGSSLQMLDDHLLRTPYLLRDAPRTLVIGVGGGVDVLNAVRRGAAHVTGVELQPITLELHRGPLADWTGHELARPEVELVAAEGRHFVRSRDDVYDLIQITAVDTFSAQTTGAYVLAESYLYTEEAFSDYLSHLAEGGVLSITLGDVLYRDPSLPPPMIARLALTARAALERLGAARATDHIVLVGQRQLHGLAAPNPTLGSLMADLLVKRAPFSPEELERIRAFAEANGFELMLWPGASGEPAIARLLQAPAEALGPMLAAETFSVEPVSDDRPFFYHFVRWRGLWSGPWTLWELPGSTTGQLMLAMMLGQSLVLGGALILIPLVRGGRGARPALARATTLGFLLYFLALGTGFMLVEISFVQKYVLLLGYPTYSLSVTLFSLLVFAGAGAALSRHGFGRPSAMLVGLLACTTALILAEALALDAIRERLLSAPLGPRIFATVLLQLPLGLVLGMYFPTGIELLRRREPRLVPWAWGVNGVASVAGAVLAVILAMDIGFSAVALLAAGIYATGTLALLVTLRGTMPRTT